MVSLSYGEVACIYFGIALFLCLLLFLGVLMSLTLLISLRIGWCCNSVISILAHLASVTSSSRLACEASSLGEPSYQTCVPLAMLFLLGSMQHSSLPCHALHSLSISLVALRVKTLIRSGIKYD